MLSEIVKHFVDQWSVLSDRPLCAGSFCSAVHLLHLFPCYLFVRLEAAQFSQSAARSSVRRTVLTAMLAIVSPIIKPFDRYLAGSIQQWILEMRLSIDALRLRVSPVRAFRSKRLLILINNYFCFPHFPHFHHFLQIPNNSMGKKQ